MPNVQNKLFDTESDCLQSYFYNDWLGGQCKLEFIINDNEHGDGVPYIEPYIISYVTNKDDETDVQYIELLDTDIKLINLYDELSKLTLANQERMKNL